MLNESKDYAIFTCEDNIPLKYLSYKYKVIVVDFVYSNIISFGFITNDNSKEFINFIPTSSPYETLQECFDKSTDKIFRIYNFIYNVVNYRTDFSIFLFISELNNDYFKLSNINDNSKHSITFRYNILFYK